MSTDRELLELAAKAAGYASLMPVPISRSECTYLAEETDGGPLKPFNPLTDDGDALRLAVKLSLIPGFMLHSDMHMTIYEGDARLAETRRAIVRAAAEKGRATP